MVDCTTCLYGATHIKCDGCLVPDKWEILCEGNVVETATTKDKATNRMYKLERSSELAAGRGNIESLMNWSIKEIGEADVRFAYRNYVEGDPIAELIRMQRNGERNIVLGGEGEHEVNVLWSFEDALQALIETCEAVGGLCWREKPNTIIVDTYHGAFHLVYEDGKLRRIFKRRHSDLPLIHWWTSTNDYDEFKKKILEAMTEEGLLDIEKDFYASDLDETEKRSLAEYVRARIGNIE